MGPAVSLKLHEPGVPKKFPELLEERGRGWREGSIWNGLKDAAHRVAVVRRDHGIRAGIPWIPWIQKSRGSHPCE